MQKILYFLLILSLASCTQSSSVKINSNIQTEKTAKHINIPGTRLFIVPPPNFTVSHDFIGLQKGEKSMINIYDLDGGNFYTNTRDFSKQGFEQRGATVFDFQEIKINGYPAKYIQMQGDPGTKAYSIVFGDTSFSTMIMAGCPVSDATTGKEIIQSLNTIWYDKNLKIDPFETANFTINDKDSKLKFFKYAANVYMYSVGGIDPKDNPDLPAMMIFQIPMDNSMTQKKVVDMIMSKAQEYGLTNTVTKNVSSEKINNNDAFQAEMYGDLKGKQTVIYNCIISNMNKAIVVQGIAKVGLDESVAEFKKLASTVNIK
ncbi:MAG: hypothetical protein ABI480_02125 [Chitinophagaceae bacterium]